jgi:hypothetical protein
MLAKLFITVLTIKTSKFTAKNTHIFPVCLYIPCVPHNKQLLFTHTTFFLMEPDIILCDAESEFLCNTSRWI